MSETSDRIIFVRVLSGEDIIGHLVSETPTALVVKNPMAVIPIPTQDGKLNIALRPWTHAKIDTDVSVNRIGAVFTIEADAWWQNAWRAGVEDWRNPKEARLAVPDKKIVTPGDLRLSR